MLLSVLTVESAVRPSAEEQSEMLLFEGKKRLEGVWKESGKKAGRQQEESRFWKHTRNGVFFFFWKEAGRKPGRRPGRQ